MATSLTITKGVASDVNVQVTPTPRQVITLDMGRSGPVGPPGPNTIGGYPISITNAQNYDALMFLANQWVNIAQTEIADGGNF